MWFGLKKRLISIEMETTFSLLQPTSSVGEAGDSQEGSKVVSAMVGAYHLHAFNLSSTWICSQLVPCSYWPLEFKSFRTSLYGLDQALFMIYVLLSLPIIPYFILICFGYPSLYTFKQ